MVTFNGFTTNKIVVNEKENPQSRCEVWKHKWNTKWNKSCLKIVALLSFTLLIAYIIHRNLSSDDYQHEKLLPKRKSVKLYYPKHQYTNQECTYLKCNEYGYENSCCFICKQIYFDTNSINEIIGNNPDYKTNNCRDKLVLKLEECTFSENKIKSNLFTYSTVPVSQLVINRGNIEDIEDGAFNFDVFKNMMRLTLQFPKIPYYRKNMFIGLQSLRWLELQNSQSSPSFENYVLEYVAASIGTLQVTQSELNSEINIKNLTNVPMPKLLDIDLQLNTRLSALPPFAFRNAPKLLSVYLADNQLSTLHEYNFPSTLQTISIANNPWVCSCELYWLQKVSNVISLNMTKCWNEGKLVNFRTIFDMDCTNYSPTTPITPSEDPITTPVVTEESEKSDIQTTSEATTSPTSPESSSPNSSPNSSPTSSTQKETEDDIWFPDDEKFTCPKNIEEDLYIFQRNAKLVIRYPNPKADATYHFFHSQNIKNCNMNRKGEIEGNFDPNTSYIFCEEAGKTQCISGHTLPVYEDQTWMTNQQKIPVILIGTFLVLFSIVLTGITTYFYLRKHPSLLIKKHEGNLIISRQPVYLPNIRPKPPLITTRLRNEEIHLGRQAPYVPVREHSVAYFPVEDASYFSPISERYMYVRQNPKLHRSISDISLKTVASYVTENQITSWRKRSKKERPPVSKLFEEPPPLPPPRNRCEVFLQENDILASNSSRQYW